MMSPGTVPPKPAEDSNVCRYQDAVHSDARQVQTWEQFRIVKCGDPGSGYEYGVMAADSELFAASTYQGKTWCRPGKSSAASTRATARTRFKPQADFLPASSKMDPA